jgi:predicted O-methyltransferase YrrM
MRTEYTDFAAVWMRAETIPGWLTPAQARVLWDAASNADPGSLVVEIGSHQGRSTVVLAAGARATGATVVAIDPFVDGPMFGGAATRDKFEANIEEAGLGDAVRLLAEHSTAIRPGWDEAIGLLYIDGKHDYWTVSDDLRWAAHVADGGQVLVHDAYSSVGVTLALLRHVLAGHSLRYLGRTASLARFEVARPVLSDRLRMLRELPWWLRNVAVKIVLRIGRLFGHHTTPDPY